MLNNDIGITDSIVTQEELEEQKIMAQKKEKKIKIIRLFSVFAYLVSVSLVAGVLSAYYICIWDPRAANITVTTETINAERIVMALQRTSDEYMFVNTAGNPYTDNENIVSEVLKSQKNNDKSSIRPVEFQLTTAKSSSYTIQTTDSNVTEPFTGNNK